MRKLTALLFAALLIATTAWADNRWNYYGAYHNALQSIPVGDLVFTLCDGSIFSYSPADSEVRTYDKTTGLSDVNIRQMAYCDELGCLVLLYANSNIDILYPEESGVVNIPQYMNSSLADKTINDISVVGTDAYLATNVGVAILNLERGEFSNTYQIGRAVKTCTFASGKIYASTTSGLFVGDTDENLLDITKWQTAGNAVYNIMRTFNGRIYAAAGTLSEIDPATGETSQAAAVNATYLNADNASRLICGNASTTISIDAERNVSTISGSNTFKYLSLAGGTYWASCGFEGLRRYKTDASGMLEADGNGITLNSPIRNYCAFMNITPSNRVLVAGGTLNYNQLNYDGTLYYYENNRFFNFEDSVSNYTGIVYRNLTGIAEDPDDPTHHFATSGETGLYEFRNGRYVEHYDHRNSGLSTVLPQSSHSYMYVRTGGLKYDNDGNLWMLNDEVDTVVKVRLKDGSWKGIYVSEVAKYPTFDHLLFDRAGRAWFTQRRTTSSHHAGIVCLDYNGTITNTADDKSFYRYNFVNQDGTSYTPNTINSLAIDNDGYIWVGTVEGPFVITDPDNFMDGSFRFTQVKVPRNDGTDNADYLLTGVSITAIAVDGANRKWFGTNGNGVYLISADNIETIYHFTTENSPLVSDNILSLAVNNATGEVMIGTDAGLMGYQAGKTANPNKVKDKDLKIYPNPVRPDFYGDVTIEGLPYGAEVKITTAGGQVVKSGTSISGEYKWDVKDAGGNDVGSGVYYVLVSTSDGKHGARGRIVVVR